MSDLSAAALFNPLPEALVLIDADERSVALDPVFCRAMSLDDGQLLNAPVQDWVGQTAFEEWVQPALRRCLAGEAVTHLLALRDPVCGSRQFSVTYHPCRLRDAVLCAMVLRDVTGEQLANDGFIMYAQWQDVLHAIDRASLGDHPLPPVLIAALERLEDWAPYRQVWIAVGDELAEAIGGETGLRTGRGLRVVAALPAEPAVLAEGTMVSLPLAADGERMGELAVWPAGGEEFGPGQLEMMGELAQRLERALHKVLLRAQLSRYTVGLEHTIVERTQEIERREERERLAQELHDAVTQSIYSLTLFAEAGRRLASVGQMERVQEYMSLLGDTAQQALKQMRLMLYELRPAVLAQVGLVQALRQRLDAVERRAGVDARLEVREPLLLLPVSEQGLYRICQEALNNALKHASAQTVVVRLRRNENEVLLEVCDDGVGFASPLPGEGVAPGLERIRERAAQLNAQLQIDTAPGHGTTVRVSLLEAGAAEGRAEDDGADAAG